MPEYHKDAESRMQRKKTYRKHEITGWLVSLAAALVLALSIRLFVFEFVRVDGASMKPTLYSEEYVFMEKLSYRFNPPKRGDIIVCYFPGSAESYIKRVIGLPGEKVKVEGGVLYIEGVPNYDYFSGTMNRDTDELIVPEECVFVMGDNRNDSRDSRYPEIGSIPYDKIQGRALFIAWPLDRIHGL